MSELLETTGEIYSISKDFKSISINGNWYHAFKPIENISKGDMIQVFYSINKKDNKTFRNIKSIQTGIKEVKEEQSKDKLDTTTVNTIIMSVKDIIINQLSENKTPDFDLLFKNFKEQALKLYS